MSLSTSVRTITKLLVIGDPLLVGQLVGDAVLITRLVKADPGVPRTAEWGLHDVLSYR